MKIRQFLALTLLAGGAFAQDSEARLPREIHTHAGKPLQDRLTELEAENRRLVQALDAAVQDREKGQAEVARWKDLAERAVSKAKELAKANADNYAAANANAELADQNAREYYRLQKEVQEWQAVALNKGAPPAARPLNPSPVRKPITVSGQIEDLREELRLRELQRDQQRFWTSFDR